MKRIKNIHMVEHRKNHILFEVVLKEDLIEDGIEMTEQATFSVAMGYPNDWTSNVKTPNRNFIDINSMDVNVVKKFCELVANGVISDDGSVYSFDEDTIKALNIPTERSSK